MLLVCTLFVEYFSSQNYLFTIFNQMSHTYSNKTRQDLWSHIMQFYPVSVSLASEGKEGITIQSWKDWLLQPNLEKPAHNSSCRCSYIVVADQLQAVTAGIIWVTSLSGRQRRRQDQQLFFPPTPACRYAGKPSQTNYSASRRNGGADEAALRMSALISSRYFLGVSLTLCVCLRSSHQCTHIKSRSAEEAAWRLDTQHLLRVQVSAAAGGLE